MTRHEIILALLAAAGGAPYRPAQVQTGLFIINRRMPQLVAGAGLSFHVYHSNPFDLLVHRELGGLANRGQVTVSGDRDSKTYAPTPSGMAKGEELLAQLGETERGFVADVSQLVRKHEFLESVSVIFRAHPETRPIRASLEAP